MVVSPTRGHVFQIHGGSAYFKNNPSGCMLRGARINQIGEGSNGVLASYIALVGCVDRLEFQTNLDTMLWLSVNRVGKAWNAGKSRLGTTGLGRTFRCAAPSFAALPDNLAI